MSISIICPDCGRRFEQIRSELAGRKVRCTCGKIVRLPKPDEAQPSNFVEASKIEKRSPTQIVSPPAPLPQSQLEIEQDSEPVNPASEAFQRHYSDLDLILASDGQNESDFRSTDARLTGKSATTSATTGKLQPGERRATQSGTQRDRQHQRIDQPGAGHSPADQSLSVNPADISRFRHALLFLSSLISAGFGFWFGYLLLSARTRVIGTSEFDSLATTLNQIYSARFGLDQLASTLSIGFVTAGWIIWLAATALLILVIIQFGSSTMQLLFQMPLFRWADGLVAAVAIGLVFLLLGTVFLHSAHMQQKYRQLNLVSIAAGEDEPANVSRLRADYQLEAQTFIRSILLLCVAPSIVFGCTMTRLLLRPH